MTTRKIFVVILVSLLISVFSLPQPTAAQEQQPPVRLSNTVPRSEGSGIYDLVDFYGSAFFRAHDGKKHSVWKSDGTADGTVEVLPGVNPYGRLTVYKDHLYFSWVGGFMRTNAEPGNMELVQNAYVLPMGIAEMHGDLYFLANTRDDAGPLFSLHRSDGTQAGTQLISSWHYFDEGETFQSQLTVTGSRLVFECPVEGGRSLCVSDGTPEGTGILKQIAPPELAHFGSSAQFQGQLYFVSRTEAEGYELWVTDGTAENTRIFSDLYPGPDSAYPSNLTVVGNSMYFVANTKNPGQTQADTYLWKTDGSPAGTTQVTDLRQHILLFRQIGNLTPVGSLLYFVTDRSVLWRTDGTAEGTYPLVWNGQGYEVGEHLKAFQGRLYFDCYKDGQTQLWVTDGTLEGTTLLQLVKPEWLLPTSQGLFFKGDDGYHGEELWISDGSSQGTRLVTNINAALTVRPPKAVISAGDRVYMISDGSLEDPNYLGSPNNPAYRLWVSDGTPQGTHLAPYPEVCSKVYFDPQFHAVMEGILYYPGPNCTIWRTDGTAGGTREVAGSPNLNWYRGFGATVLGKRLLFFYESALWVIEGQPEQARMVKTISSWMTDNASIYSVTTFHGRLFFITFTRNNSTQNQPRGNWKLWASDGTQAGTTVVYQVDIPEPFPTDLREPSAFVIANDLLFFSAYHPQKGFVLYQSDGTQTGTNMVPGQPTTGLTLPLVEAGGYLYAANTIREYGFGPSLNEARYRTALYRTQGDASGLSLAVQFPDLIAYDSTELREAAAFGNKLFLSFRQQLWISDGTASGTYSIEQVRYPSQFTPIGPRVFFSAYSSTKGSELWSSDGSAQGTSMVADLRDGWSESERSSSPNHLTRLDDRLFFAANDGIHGIQLWAYHAPFQKMFIPLTTR